MSYVVNCDYYAGRNANYNLRDRFKELFNVCDISQHNNQCANVSYYTKFNEQGKIDNDGQYYIWDIIPSALLMYRLICIFNDLFVVPKPYKCTWLLCLEHTPSGNILTFGDSKGGSEFWTDYTNINEVPEQFFDDTKDLINYLCCDECAHPYDGLTAGGIA